MGIEIAVTLNNHIVWWRLLQLTRLWRFPIHG